VDAGSSVLIGGGVKFFFGEQLSHTERKRAQPPLRRNAPPLCLCTEAPYGLKTSRETKKANTYAAKKTE
jgi:hypothetical protein